MKGTFTVAILAILFPVYGQKDGPKPAPQENRAQDAKKKDAKETSAQHDAEVVINQQTTNTEREGAKDNSKAISPACFLLRIFLISGCSLQASPESLLLFTP
jgi:hypothetical protein